MLFRSLLCLLATVSISHQSPVVLHRRLTDEQIQALQAQLVGANPAVQAEIQKQISAALAGASSSAAPDQAPNEALPALVFAFFKGLNDPANPGGSGDIGLNGNPNTGTSSPESSEPNALCQALRAQMNELENQLTGADAPTRAAIQQQQQAIISQMTFC
ncbi:hypothetical protein HDU81_001935 [Chytriomyces hyalinus]|nr:hypothetical protein HDU81_001935 [Chytriomyces hyalinus]